jgi:amidase
LSGGSQENPRHLRLSRRSFLRSGVVATGIPATMAAEVRSEGFSNGTGAFSHAKHEPFDLDEITITKLQNAMNLGKFTARSLTEKYRTRIERIDKQGPAVNSVIELNPDALAVAEELDRERKTRGTRGPLHGVPVLIKDNIGTADRMTTTAGSLALAGSIPSRDSFIAKRLREAGAVILGKTNLSEWANFRSSHSSSGWSGRGGQTLNPYALDRNPCGSSSGSAVAVAANLCAVAVGTETDGSIVCPASANGIVGIKPTVGLISRSGIIPIAHSQDTAGPMARTVADAAILLGALAGVDPQDRATTASAGKGLTDYTPFLDPHGLKGARIGVARKYFGFSEAVDHLINAAIAVMKDAGAVIADPADLPSHGSFDESENQVLLYEFKADLNSYLAALSPATPVHSLKQLIEFNDAHRASEMPYFGQDLFLKAEAKDALTSKEYLDALEKSRRLARTEGIDAVMDKSHLDALVAPTGGPAWVIDLIDGDRFTGGSSNAAAVAGYPNINVPAGFVFGLPVGISFFGRAYSEPVLIKLAYAFEQATRLRRPPGFSPSAKLSE